MNVGDAVLVKCWGRGPNRADRAPRSATVTSIDGDSITALVAVDGAQPYSQAALKHRTAVADPTTDQHYTLPGE